MQNRMKTFVKVTSILTYIVFLLLPFSSSAQPRPLSEETSVSILTCGSGDQLHALFGHTAIRFRDPSQNLDVVFNYGTFDFDTSFFYLKFIKGNLDYFLSATDFQTFITAYTHDQRDVFEQELIATTKKKQKLFNVLLEQLNSDAKYYRYKFIDRNCTTMVKDQLEDLWSSDLLHIEKINIDELSYRNIVNKFLEDRYFERLGINILFGSNTDKQADKVFLPEELMASLTVSKVGDENIAKGAEILYKAPTSDKSSFFLNSMFTVIVLLGGLFFVFKKKLDLIMLNVFGGFGILLGLIMLLTEHNEVWWNYNILLFNPILIFIVWAFKNQNEISFKFGRYAFYTLSIFYAYLAYHGEVIWLTIPFLIYLISITYRLDTLPDDDE